MYIYYVYICIYMYICILLLLLFFFFFEILYNIIYIMPIYSFILNFLFFFWSIIIDINIAYTIVYRFFFYYYYYYYFFCDKLVNFYVLGWLLYQRIFNTFRSLPYHVVNYLIHCIIFIYYFHILNCTVIFCLYYNYMGRIKIILILILIQ